MDRATCIQPFTLMELVVKQAIVSILSKPQWSVKWQDDSIRRKWLREIRRAYLERTFTHGRWWRPKALARKNIAELAKKRLSDIKYAEHLTGDDRYERFVGLHAFLIVQTFFDQYRDAAAPAKRHLDPSVVPRLVKFTWTALEGTGDGIAANVANALEAEAIQATPQTITMLSDVCERIRAELESVEAYIVREVDAAVPQAAEQLASPPDAFHTDDVATITSVGVHGAWLSDDLVPAALKAKFVCEVAVLENVPAKAKDWHPNTGKKVLDLVHPSLFCWVQGRTCKLSTALDPASFTDPADQMEQLVQLAPSLSVDKSVPFFGMGSSARFQWLPTDVHVRDDGSVRILSYINNLHPRRHAALYDSLAAIIARFVPLFDRALAAYNAPFPARAFSSTDDQIGDVAVRPCPPTAATDSDSAATPAPLSAADVVTLTGRTLQVIVKVAEIVLTPASPTYKGGTWHIEGTHRELIVATGLYYFGCDNIADSRLSFRVNIDDDVLHEHVGMHDEAQGVGLTYALFEGSTLVQQLGSVRAVEDRCLVFPNGVQHKVEPFELADQKKRGVRKILALFLVDPSVTVASTGVVPPQQRDWVDELLAPAAPTPKKPRVSAPATQSDVRQTHTMTLDEAKAFRLELMKERSLTDKQRGESNKMAAFNLCEH